MGRTGILFALLLFWWLTPASVVPASPVERVASVDLFVATDCPIANACAPELERLYRSYREKGVDIRLVFPDRDIDEEAVRKHLSDFALTLPFTIDHDHGLVKRGGATTTPEAVVYDRLGVIVYRGKIDNRYSGFGERRGTVTEFYLRDALDAVLSGQRPAVSRTKAVGCLIER